MTKPELTPYDGIAYPTFPISYTHPDRLATVATHFGMKPAPVERCRVLELGCSTGANLLSMAVMLPESEFVGVDLAGRPIAQGKARVEALGLKNLAFRQIDLLEMAPGYGKFDYIIAHGLYAWLRQRFVIRSWPSAKAACNLRELPMSVTTHFQGVIHG